MPREQPEGAEYLKGSREFADPQQARATRQQGPLLMHAKVKCSPTKCLPGLAVPVMSLAIFVLN
ncbi:MAG: hypothetical protein NTY24_11290 [Mycobacterium sp.]|nr:hypothetical protein [Mycobacterium sp.]MCX6480939.1 hypothetical protein [Mycobacterium sp.]